ncbi:MAG: diguanylate cyclase, partial [Deltaproteobacteria bacterium]
MSEEALREALIDLERARKEAEAFRKEAESLLSGLQILTLSESTSEMFARLLDLLQGAIGSSASFVMVRRKDGDFVVESSTDARFLGSRWPVGRFLSGVLRGRPKACFDVEEIAEWRAQPSSLRTEVASALHLPLRGKRQDAVLVCTHPERGFFRPSHLRLAKRLSLLASQALAHKDLQHEVLERARLFSLSPDMLGMIGFDGTLRCANPAWEATLGFGEETLQNGSFWERFVHPEDLPGTRAELAPLLDGKRSCATFENRCRTERNEWCWFHWSVAAVVEEELLYVIATDITERRTMEEALRRSEERYALAAMGAKDGLWDWDLPANKIYVSPRWNVMVGNAEVEGVLDREAWFGFVHPEDRAPLRRKIARRISENARHIENEHRILHRSGYPIWVHFRGLIVRDSEGRTVRMVGSQTDITERKRHEAELRYRARHDQLTGLVNRTLFRERLQQVIDRKKRDPHHEFAVLFLDLDRFKHLNESLGHLAGDALLVEIARRLKGCVRKGDTVSRFGGDEFTILLHEIEDAGEAKEVAERIQQALSRPFDIFGQEIHTSASIGIALSSGGDYDEEAFLRDADIAMYRAKALGKARCELFDRSMHQEAVGRLEIETELRSAIEAEAFVLYYQPIVALDTLRPIGFEALIRWRHPTRGIVPPLSFIPIAE